MNNAEQTVKELTLMLLYLTLWRDGPVRLGPDMVQIKSWKGYDFGALNALEEEGYIYGRRRNKSVALDDSGILKAKELLAKYGIKEDDT